MAEFWQNLQDSFVLNFIKDDRWKYLTDGLATTLVITHNAAIAAIADRVVNFANGTIVSEQRNATRKTPSEVSW